MSDIVEQSLASFYQDHKKVTEIFTKIPSQYTIAAAIIEIDNLIQARLQNMPSGLNPSETAAFIQINTIYAQILEGYKWQLHIYDKWDTKGLQPFYRNTKLKNLRDVSLAYYLRSNPDFLLVTAKESNLRSYVNEILSIHQHATPDQKFPLSKAATMRFWGGAVFLMERLHYAAQFDPNYPSLTSRPLGAVLKQTGLNLKSFENFILSDFEYGSQYLDRIVTYEFPNAKHGMQQIEQHYVDLFREQQQSLHICLSSEVPAYLTATRLQALNLQLEALARHHSYRDGIKNKSTDSKSLSDAHKVCQILAKSSYLEDYIQSQKNLSNHALLENLRKIQNLNKQFENFGHITSFYPHQSFSVVTPLESLEHALYAAVPAKTKKIGASTLYLYNGVAILDPRNIKEFYHRTYDLGQITHNTARRFYQKGKNFALTRTYRHPAHLYGSADRLSLALNSARVMINGLDDCIMRFGAETDILLCNILDDDNLFIHSQVDTLRSLNKETANNLHNSLNFIGNTLAIPSQIDAALYRRYQDLINHQLPANLSPTQTQAYHALKDLNFGEFFRQCFSKSDLEIKPQSRPSLTVGK